MNSQTAQPQPCMPPPPVPHVADTLNEMHCKVAFISAAVWAFASLSKYDSMPGPDEWQGLGHFIRDIEDSLSLLRKP